MADLAALTADWRAEAESLAERLATLSEPDWDAPTPSPEWDVRHQVAHLAWFDRVTRLAISDHGAFRNVVTEVAADIQGYVTRTCRLAAGRSGEEMLAWWELERRQLLAALGQADPVARVPWFGPSMSLASKISARLMETWAHGQDVLDALGLSRAPSARLRHVARIGILALPNSYLVRGLAVPDVSVSVTLEGPSGETWQWGSGGDANHVTGLAEDFCLVVTQRRHVRDTGLALVGPVAREWMSIAQAFAGPPGQGRSPGQFGETGSQPRQPA